MIAVDRDVLAFEELGDLAGVDHRGDAERVGEHRGVRVGRALHAHDAGELAGAVLRDVAHADHLADQDHVGAVVGHRGAVTRERTKDPVAEVVDVLGARSEVGIVEGREEIGALLHRAPQRAGRGVTGSDPELRGCHQLVVAVEHQLVEVEDVEHVAGDARRELLSRAVETGERAAHRVA